MRSAPNDGRKAGGVLAFGIAMSMSAMTYKLERFRAKWAPVRVKKTRQNKKLEPGSDYIRTEKAPDIPATPAARDRLSVRPDTPSFQRPGADVLNEAIPAFFIGRNHSGFWVARDANGKSGGLFWSREAALRFARTVWPDGCAMIFPQDRLELDIDNAGSPLISWLEAAKHWLARHSKPSLRLSK
jgi:hypothetical protein